jgi:hypothetical protein
MFNRNYKLVTLAVLASYAAVGQDNPISVSLATKAGLIRRWAMQSWRFASPTHPGNR